MPTLKEVLADKAKYPDNLVWNLEGGTAVTLAQLRGLSDESQTAITKREKELETQRNAIAADEAKTRKAQETTANLFVALQRAQQAIADGKFNELPAEIKNLFGNVTPVGGGNGNNNNDPFAALQRLENDTLLGPVVQAMRKVATDAAKAQAAVDANIKVQQAMATNYMNGVLVDRYERIVPADKQDKITLNSLIQDAVNNKEYSADSVPDIRRAYQRATAADKQAEHDKAIADAAIKKYKDDLAAANGGAGGSEIFVPSPSGFGLDVHNRSGSAPKPFKSLDDAFAAAAKDKDIWSQVDQTVQ